MKKLFKPDFEMKLGLFLNIGKVSHQLLTQYKIDLMRSLYCRARHVGTKD